MSFSRRLVERLSELSPRAALSLGVLVFTPTLFIGFFADDWFLLGRLEGFGLLPDRSPFDLFFFQPLIHPDAPPEQGGLLPWWGGEGFRVHLFRPLSSITHWLDHQLWGRWALGHHLSSLALWGLLLAAVLGFFQELATDSRRGTAAVVLAGLIFALDEAHGWDVGWISNRNALVSVLFAVLSLRFYHRYRRAGGLRPLGLALACLVLGLCGGETAVGVVAWVVAWEVCLAQGSAASRIRAAAPMVLLGLAYLVGWKLLGFGSQGSGLYVSPLTEPITFLTEALPQRLPVLLLGALTPLAPELVLLGSSGLGWALAVGGLLVVLGIFGLLRPHLAADPTLRFAALGAVLSTIPMTCTFPHARLLLLPTVGFAWVLGCVLDDALAARRGDRAAPVQPPRALEGGIVKLHLLLAPIFLLSSIGSLPLIGQHIEAVSLEAEIASGPEVADDLVAILSAPSPFLALWMSSVRWGHGASMPAGLWFVSGVPGDQKLTRTGATTFTLEARPPGFLASLAEALYRDGTPVQEGERFVRGALQVRADSVDEGQLVRVEVDLQRSLDSEDVRLLAWNGRRLAQVDVPAVGDCAILELPVQGVFPPPLGRASWDEGECAAPAQGSERLAQASPATEGEAVTGPSAEGAASCRLELRVPGGEWELRSELECPGERGLGIVAVGDPGLPGPILDATTASARELCSGDTPCDLLVVAGDLLYGPGSEAQANWRGVWDESLATLGLPGISVLGNHEYRHEPDPALKREAVYAADGRAGLVLPAPSYAARVVRGGKTLVAVAAMDTDSIANPGPEMPGGAEDALKLACAEDAPVVALGHHPASSQGRHHGHEAHVEARIRTLLRESTASGCRVVAAVAGHDHDQQLYSPGCEQDGMPAVVVTGVSARGYRGPGPQHLGSCRSPDAESRYHAGPRESGGFAVLELRPDGTTAASLFDVSLEGQRSLLSELSW